MEGARSGHAEKYARRVPWKLVVWVGTHRAAAGDGADKRPDEREKRTQ